MLCLVPPYILVGEKLRDSRLIAGARFSQLFMSIIVNIWVNHLSVQILSWARNFLFIASCLLHACARVSGDYELLLSDDDGGEHECERDSSSTAPRLASRKVVKSVGKKLKKSLSVVAHSPAASRRTGPPRKEVPRYSYKWRVRSVRLSSGCCLRLSFLLSFQHCP